MSDDVSDRIAAIFVEEASEDIPKLARLLMELEAQGADQNSDAKVREIFRLAHTLKGSASSVGRDDLASVAHQMETGLDLVRKKKLAPSRAMVDALLAALDLLQKGLRQPLPALESAKIIQSLKDVWGGTAASPAAPRTVAPEAHASTTDTSNSSAVLQALMVQWAAIAQEQAEGSLAELTELLGAWTTFASERPLSRQLVNALLVAISGYSAASAVPRGVAEVGLLASDFLRSELSEEGSKEEVDALQSMLRKAAPLAPGEAAPASLSPQEKSAPRADVLAADSAVASLNESTVRIPVALLDTIVYRIDELVALKLRIDYQRRQVEEAQTALEGTFAREGDSARHLTSGVEGVKQRLESVRSDLAQEVHLLGLLAQALQDDIRDIRMISLGLLLEPFRRMVRDLAFSLGKEAVLEVQGENVRIDKRLLEMMRDPLLHILRNAVDHGLEPADKRVAAGKQACGVIKIHAESRESAIWISITDDGRGIHPAQVRAKAVERGLIDVDRAQGLTDRESINLVFQPGFSTQDAVTELSGRGVGLDVVAENVATLGGRIEFYSEVGKGTQFTLILPLTIAASSGLLVRKGKHIYCLPLTAVEEVISLTPAEVGYSHGRLAIKRRNQTLSFFPLDDLLASQPCRRPDDPGFAIILAISDRRLALGVDTLLGQEELVVKSVVVGTPHLRFVTGASNLADGRLVAVLDPVQLMEAATSSSQAKASGPRGQKKTVLVADDSLTSRTLVSSVLEQAGYRVILAYDGDNAFQLLQGHAVDLVVSDVEMPVLDGYGLVKRIRASAATSSLPAILITSLSAPEDRARGAEAGANAYIVKSEFNPPTFLGMVADLLGHSKARS